MLELLLGLTPSPIEQTANILLRPPEKPKTSKVLTVKQKIKQNYYKCDTERSYIRADNARCLAKPKYIPVSTQNTARAPVNSPQATYKPVSNRSFSNTYDYGYCTWGVANWVNVPNTWGNANTWASRAVADGYIVNSQPAVGAVAAHSGGRYGHVALVIGVAGNKVTIREMNFRGLGVTSTRTVSQNAFTYIHL